MATDAQAPNPPRLAADRARRLWLARLSSGWKEPVYVATTANVTLSNVQTIDGVAVPDGARVLVKDQTAGAENGIYEAKYGTWLRTSDADHADKLGAATKVAVQRGTTNGGTTWRLTTTGTVTLGTTALTWAADGGSGTMTAAAILAALLTVDGAGSGLDADTLDGISSAGFDAAGAAAAAQAAAVQRANHTGSQLASTISDFNTAVRTNRLDQMAAPTGTVSMGAQFVSNVYAPFFGTDAANKTYVDTTTAAAVAAALTTAFDFKASVRAATTANITLSGAQTIDGVSVVAGDRVLVKNQSTGANNGIYVAAAGAWSRATDADASAEVTAGLTVPVTEGTVNGGRMWMLSTADAITLGTTALTFTRVDTGDLQAASNLSDLLSVSTARTNLGLGTLALASTVVSADITDGTIVNADLADMTTKTYKGRTAGTTGPPQDVSAATLATDLASQAGFTGTYQTIALAATKATTTDLIDAKGDRLIGSADNTLVRKAAPSNGKFGVADSAQSDGWKDIDLPWHLSIDPVRVPAFSTVGGTIAAWATYYQFSALNDEVVYNVQLGPGTWTFGLWRTIFTSYGILTVTLDGTTIATLDNYSAGSVNPGQVLTTGIAITAPGVYALKLKTTGKNASSSAYNQRLWAIDFTRTA